jgi:hypothetical protein
LRAEQAVLLPGDVLQERIVPGSLSGQLQEQNRRLNKKPGEVILPDTESEKDPVQVAAEMSILNTVAIRITMAAYQSLNLSQYPTERHWHVFENFSLSQRLREENKR